MICHNITCGKTHSGKVSEEKGEIPFLKVANIENKVEELTCLDDSIELIK